MAVDVSVVIPTYRRQRELTEALASVLCQSDVTLEVLVVDDCPDGSARDVVLGLNDPRVTYLRNPRPTGGVPSVVRNLGWPRTTGRFLHFLDDDDLVPLGHYATAMAAFEALPNVGLVFGRIEPFGICSQAQLSHERQYFADAARNAASCGWFGTRFAFAGRMLFDSALLVCSAGLLRRECVERVAGFDPDIRLLEDADFYVRAIRECGARFVDHLVLRYRIGSPSLMHVPVPPPAQLRVQHEGRRRMQRKYRNQHGRLEFYALALFARTVLKVV